MEPYIPEPLPLKEIDWLEHIPLIGRANAEIARYDGVLKGIVNPEILLSPLTTREAVLSSQIEGTQASLTDVLRYDADAEDSFSSQKVQDIQEILNYRRAMTMAVADLKQRPLCINMIRDIHRILLDSVRGRNREPGELRRIQNYIAPAGTPIERASFVPPPPQMVMDLLSNWEGYLHTQEKDPLVQLAVLKAQFEIIHPFRDGNGRIGRMLVPLILYSKQLLSTPMFYISAYLEYHRDEYYARLQAVSRDGDWDGWITFFLTALVEQAKENNGKAEKILALYNEMKDVVPEITKSHYSVQAIDALFSRPLFKGSDFSRMSGIPKDSAHRILNALKSESVIIVIGEGMGRRSTVYAFPRLISVTEGMEPPHS